jgi:hypothetical protein
MQTGNRAVHKRLPTVGSMILEKKEHYMWHPKGSYVLITPTLVNQYTVTLKVDLWNISYNLNRDAEKKFSRAYLQYLDEAIGKKKGIKSATWGLGGCYNTIQVLIEDADFWMDWLWSVCSEEECLEWFSSDIPKQ